MKLIVGLGNPGRDFENTYHNIGFMFLDYFAKKHGCNFNKSNKLSVYTQAKIDGQILMLIKPLTYMNLSGEAVAYFVNYYKLNPEDVIVACDDVDLPKGTVRYRQNGSGGTHNGLKNIVYKLKSENFHRLKFGISKENQDIDLKDYVLSKIDEESLKKITGTFDEAIQKLNMFLKN